MERPYFPVFIDMEGRLILVAGRRKDRAAPGENSAPVRREDPRDRSQALPGA